MEGRYGRAEVEKSGFFSLQINISCLNSSQRRRPESGRHDVPAQENLSEETRNAVPSDRRQRQADLKGHRPQTLPDDAQGGGEEAAQGADPLRDRAGEHPAQTGAGGAPGMPEKVPGLPGAGPHPPAPVRSDGPEVQPGQEEEPGFSHRSRAALRFPGEGEEEEGGQDRGGAGEARGRGGTAGLQSQARPSLGLRRQARPRPWLQAGQLPRCVQAAEVREEAAGGVHRAGERERAARRRRAAAAAVRRVTRDSARGNRTNPTTPTVHSLREASEQGRFWNLLLIADGLVSYLKKKKKKN